MVKNIRDGYEVVTEEHKKWTFAGAFLYSLTVITTIGKNNHLFCSISFLFIFLFVIKQIDEALKGFSLAFFSFYSRLWEYLS